MMARFRRLTDTEARQLSRSELLDRIEAEQEYWHRKRHSMTDADRAAEREFRRIWYALAGPDAVLGWMQELTDKLAPAGPPAGMVTLDEGQQAALDYARRVFLSPEHDR